MIPRLVNLAIVVTLTAGVAAQTPAPPTRPSSPPQRRPPMQAMTVTSPSFPDGGAIPALHTQMGAEVSPALEWSNVPDGVQSFVLIVHDIDAPIGNGTDDVLHWMLWNIPGSARALPAGVAAGSELPDGTRQISASGPYFRGPGALASGPVHHYVFELYALDATLDVPAVGQNPPQTRAAIMAAMAGKVRGKGTYVGLFKRAN